jgi:predicted metal-dependent phosphoesterase TrpH
VTPRRHAVGQERVWPRPLIPAKADFHTHTTRSDGVLEPPELVRQVLAAGVRTLAITDHDSLAGVHEMLGTGVPDGLRLIPGVEINALTRGLDVPEGELHVIGLGVDVRDATLEAALRRQRDARRARFEQTVERFRELGMPIDEQVARLDLTRDDALGRPTVARALVAAGLAESVEDAFSRLLGWGMPGYVPRTGLGPVEAIQTIRAAGGLPVLAHFAWAPDRRDLILGLVEAGLAGIETHHRSFDTATRRRMTSFARAFGLLPSGGSDYHGDLGPYAQSHAELFMPTSVERAVLEAIDRW